jgi:putative tryptophan/tyrosine transport system substrate-binding protein
MLLLPDKDEMGNLVRRRDFIVLISGTVAWPLAARAQQSTMPVIGFVSIASREATLQASWYHAFHERFLDHGWVPGKTITIEYRFADNDRSKLATLAQELVGLKPDAIFVPTRPALPTIRDATRTIPIIFVSLGDPVAEGWVTNLARPGGNLTGVAGLSPELAGKRLELLRELVPSLSKVAVLRNPANTGEVVAVEATQALARGLGMSVVVEHAGKPAEFDRVIGAIADASSKAVIVLPDPMFLANRSELIRLINQARLPAIYMETGFVASGGLMSYGPNFTQLFRRAATYVDKILKGAWRYAHRAAHEIRTHHQSRDGKCPWPPDPTVDSPAR